MKDPTHRAGPPTPGRRPCLRLARALTPIRTGPPHTIWAFTIELRAGVAATAHQMSVIDVLEVFITPI